MEKMIMLRDEVKPSAENPDCRPKIQASNDISREVSMFLACGGAIKEIPPGETANKEMKPLALNEFSGEISMREAKKREEGQKIAAKKRRKNNTDLFK